MIRYTLATPGPLLRKEFQTEREAVEWVEKQLPLKRGWTIKRERVGDAIVFHRFNSNGRYLKGYSVTLYRSPEQTPRKRTAQRSKR